MSSLKPAARYALGKQMLLSKNILVRRVSTFATVRASTSSASVGRSRALLRIPPPPPIAARGIHFKAVCSPLADYAKLEASTRATTPEQQPLDNVMADLFPDNAATPTTVLEQLEVEDIMEQEEYDFARDEQQQSQEDYPRTMRVMSASSTPHINHSDDADNHVAKVHYDEDYDEYNLHMMPSEANTSYHHEVMESMEMLQHDDVFTIRESRKHVYEDDNEGYYFNEKTVADPLEAGDEYPYNDIDEVDDNKSAELEEMEEDWEMLHSELENVEDTVDDVDDMADDGEY